MTWPKLVLWELNINKEKENQFLIKQSVHHASWWKYFAQGRHDIKSGTGKEIRIWKSDMVRLQSLTIFVKVLNSLPLPAGKAWKVNKTLNCPLWNKSYNCAWVLWITLISKCLSFLSYLQTNAWNEIVTKQQGSNVCQTYTSSQLSLYYVKLHAMFLLFCP